MQIKPLGKVIILIVLIGLGIGVWRLWSKIAPSAAVKETVIPGKVTLGEAPNSAASPDAKFVLPGTGLGVANKPEVRFLGYAWNAQMGILLANGGAQATQGSLMAKHGVNLKWSRQDDNSKLQEALVSFATELSQGNPQPTKGAHFITIMGDGGAAFLQGLNPVLRRIGPEYQAKIVDAAGYSRGEDKLMGPAEWKANPSASRGGFVAGVVRDGDWNIAQKWLGDNGLRTNPDEKTYDPDALNWVNASDYIDATQKYIAGYSETRPVVRNGKRTGETKTITVDAVVTWTPGDVAVAEKKGGLVSIVSTKEYSSQMPCVVIGIDKWMRSNRSTVDGMIAAIAEGGDAIKASPAALQRGSEISAELYHEADAGPEFWSKYFRGVTETDKTGESVELGGSSVNNLADSLLAFGLVPGSSNLVAATYTDFGNLVKSQYPELVPTFPSADSIIDTSYLSDVAKQVAPNKTVIAAVKPIYNKKKAITAVIGRRNWNIQFNAGKATFTPQAKQELQKLLRSLLIASGTVVEVHGHTDNQGNPATSKPLSEARAFAVKQWLEAKSPVNFPEGRVRVFAHGDSNPIAPNTTPEGRARNRRVEIVIGTNR
ncbi:MAG: OmpA family protein [Capsulimonas sp.]|uniref:OmpA family protein n=1 Tax=Capsulimonas sp. TaxID=2494211 RepID=UPI003264C5A2